MRTPAKKTPPAATEGAEYNTAEAPLQATVSSAAALSHNLFWDDPLDEVADSGADPSPSPELALPPGLVGELATYFYNSARYPMKEGAMLAALGLVAGIGGRTFNYGDSGLNLYLMLLAESGRGKEDMRAGIDRMLTAVRPTMPMVDEFIGPDTFASGQALVRVLESTPCFISMQGEFGLRLKELNDPRAPSSLIVLRRVLLDLYSKSGWNGWLRPTVYSDREKNTKVIHAPTVTILGESTPGHVFDNLSFRDIEDGLLPRCLILECNDQRPRANRAAGFPPPPALASWFGDFVATCLTTRQNNTYQPVLATTEATAALQAMQDDLDDAYNDATRDPHDRSLWNRAGLNIKRVAAIIAVGCMRNAAEPPLIQEVHVRWATEFVELCIGGLAQKFRDGIVGTGESRQDAEVRKYVREFCLLTVARRRVYKVPKVLAESSGYIGLDYLRRRARSCSAFTQDRRGLDRALTDTLNTLCRTGALIKLSEVEVRKKFGTRGEVYALANSEQWR